MDFHLLKLKEQNSSEKFKSRKGPENFRLKYEKTTIGYKSLNMQEVMWIIKIKIIRSEKNQILQAGKFNFGKLQVQQPQSPDYLDHSRVFKSINLMPLEVL